ncbi:MAG: phytoene/squalene synthase family protein [Luteolibacter sp.]
MSVASEITRKAKSNLAFALKILPRERREDMVIFYAFCRTMDDLADNPGMPLENRVELLNQWKNGLLSGFAEPDEFQSEVIGLRDRHRIPNDLLAAIIDGCQMDVHPQRFGTWQDLSDYIWKVACAVGLVSIRLFGCEDPGSERYAVALGHALQLTNILRDIAEDLTNGRRIYLPLADLAQFGYTEQDLIDHVRDERFLNLMAFEAERAEGFFREAAAALPAGDQAALVPARIMGEIYHVLLEKMGSGHFDVFKKRYSVSKARKLAILSKHLIARSS